MTTRKTPKPFHIGTKVLPKSLGEGDIQTPDEVLCVWKTLMWVYQPYMQGVSVEVVDEFVHADDGSPLGEWVPISEEQWDDVSQSHDGSQMLQWLGINAIIRGEVSQ